jgi:DNA-binding response OmpR family regulator
MCPSTSLIKKVLLVEDDADIREALVDFLESEGFQIECASNGEEGLVFLRDQVKAASIGLILLDMMMPIKDGAQFLSEQRSDQAIKSIPVVLMSADPRASQKTGGIAADGYLKKPVEIDDLLNTVKRYCA